MYFLGFSINNFTLLALTLAIGIVVDDAIIVLENAYRHQEELDETPEEAATNGTREIAFAVIATTISLVAVFTPLAFLTGIDRAAVQRIRYRGRGLGDHLRLRGADAHTDALRQDPPGAAAARRSLPGAGSGLQRAGRGIRPDAAPRAAACAGRSWWSRWSLTFGGGVGVPDSLEREFVPPEDRGWFFSSSSRPRARRWPTPTAISVRPRRSWPRPGDRELLQRGEHRRRCEPRHRSSPT